LLAVQPVGLIESFDHLETQDARNGRRIEIFVLFNLSG